MEVKQNGIDIDGHKFTFEGDANIVAEFIKVKSFFDDVVKC